MYLNSRWWPKSGYSIVSIVGFSLVKGGLVGCRRNAIIILERGQRFQYKRDVGQIRLEDMKVTVFETMAK